MLAADRQVVDLNVVVRLAADRGALLRQGDLLEHEIVQTEYQFGHSRPRSVIFAIRKAITLRRRRGAPRDDPPEYNRNAISGRIQKAAIMVAVENRGAR